MTVSVVIPCYRCAATVRRAALSVAQQTVRPLELILVEDASGDGTGDVLRALVDELGRTWVRVVMLDKNVGAAAARNVGWESARGEYVAFLDADDSWLPRKLERQLAFMHAHPQFAITGHRAAYSEEAGHAGPPGGASWRYRELSRLEVLLKNPMVTPSFVVRRALPLRFEAGRRHMEDHLLLQKAVFSGMRVARLEEALARVHKPAYGAGGLSGELRSMERAELDNYRLLRRAGYIGGCTRAVLTVYSLLKFCRRAAWVGMRRMASFR